MATKTYRVVVETYHEWDSQFGEQDYTHNRPHYTRHVEAVTASFGWAEYLAAHAGADNAWVEGVDVPVAAPDFEDIPF